MGGSSSKRSSQKQYPAVYSSHRSNSYQQSPYSQNSTSTPQHRFASDPHKNGHQTPQSKYARIADSFETLEEVTSALAHAGLESSNLIVGIDFTKSNEWTGAKSFNRRNLHNIGSEQNPYEQAISIIGKTLSGFDEDNLIPCYGFGDAMTHDQDVFSFYPDDKFCNGFEDVLKRYREIVPKLTLSGPTSFAPVIERAISIVDNSVGQYHVLLIIADGQVTQSPTKGHISPQEKKTVEAIVKASEYPLSIVLVGVGDGPWEMMHEFDDNIPARAFDNFQFVNFTDIMSKNMSISRKQTDFALSALMEIPSQYKATIELSMLGRKTGRATERKPRPPPHCVTSSTSRVPSSSNSNGHNQPTPPTKQDTLHEQTFHRSPPPRSDYDNQVCVICLSNSKDMAFGCGHQTCSECGENIEACPICRSSIQTRIKLF